MAAEAEAKRAQAAIQAKQQELHQIEQQRQREVPCYLPHLTLTALLCFDKDKCEGKQSFDKA